MKQIYRLAFYTALLAAATASAQTGGVVVQPPPPLPGVYGGGVLLDCPQHVYPTEALRYELEGKTVVELLIGDDGRAHGQRLVTSSGWKILDQATLSHLAACRYSPVTRNGQPAGAHWQKLAYAWRLRDHEGERASRPILLVETCAAGDRLVLTDDPLGADGTLMRFLTSPQGMAFGIKVEKSSGDAAIDEEAVRVLQSCKFTPSQLKGKPGPGNAFARYRIDPSP